MDGITQTGRNLAARAWEALGEDPALLTWVMADGQPAHLPSPWPSGMLATASLRVAAAQGALIGRRPGSSGAYDPTALPVLLIDPEPHRRLLFKRQDVPLERRSCQRVCCAVQVMKGG